MRKKEKRGKQSERREENAGKGNWKGEVMKKRKRERRERKKIEGKEENRGKPNRSETEEEMRK